MKTIKLNQQYLNFNNPDTRILVIESGKGTGKTRWMQDNLADVSALFLSHRVALTKDLANRTNSAHYSDNAAYHSKRLVICVNSLMNLTNSDTHKNATIVIDEATQVLRHLIGETCSGDRQEILNTLANKVYNCKQLVLLDADMNQETLDYFVEMFNYRDVQVSQEDITWVTNTYKSNDRVFIEFPSSDSLQVELLKDLAAGLNCYVACDTQAKVDLISSVITKSPIEIKGKLTVHGGNSNQLKQTEFINDVNLIQKNYQVVVASPSLFTGMDINQPHFDKVYLFADGAFATATDLLQASARVRTVKEVKFWVTTSKSSELTDWKQILSNKERVAFGTGWTGTVNQALAEARNGDVWAWDFDIATGIYKVKDSAYMKMFCQLQAIQNKSLNDLHSSFLEAANKEGRVVSHAVSEDEVRQSEAMKQASKVIKQQNREFKHQAILNAPVIDSDRLFILKLDPSLLSTEETNSIKRYKLLEMVGGLVEYLPEAVRHESKMFNAVKFQSWLSRSLEDLAIQDEKDLLKAPSERKYRVKTVNLIREFLNIVNYDGSLKGEELKAFRLERKGNPHLANHKWFTQNAVEFKELLGVSVPKDVEEKPFQFIQAVLNTLGLATIDKRVSVRKGDVLVNSWCGGVYPDVDADEKIRVRKYYLDLSSVEMMNKILKAKEENFAKKGEMVGLPF
ncbi:plasmid replication protein, CyRepA1 family [Nostoc sp. CALU 1950]|uniref:plasmid replication protein, CyRepA1 family n=1 Tax=Nostoc sp. CALU 1950 TaxID=3104321 RepID=UPI003EB83D92